MPVASPAQTTQTPTTLTELTLGKRVSSSRATHQFNASNDLQVPAFSFAISQRLQDASFAILGEKLGNSAHGISICGPSEAVQRALRFNSEGSGKCVTFLFLLNCSCMNQDTGFVSNPNHFVSLFPTSRMSWDETCC